MQCGRLSVTCIMQHSPASLRSVAFSYIHSRRIVNSFASAALRYSTNSHLNVFRLGDNRQAQTKPIKRTFDSWRNFTNFEVVTSVLWKPIRLVAICLCFADRLSVTFPLAHHVCSSSTSHFIKLMHGYKPFGLLRKNRSQYAEVCFAYVLPPPTHSLVLRDAYREIVDLLRGKGRMLQKLIGDIWAHIYLFDLEKASSVAT